MKKTFVGIRRDTLAHVGGDGIHVEVIFGLEFEGNDDDPEILRGLSAGTIEEKAQIVPADAAGDDKKVKSLKKEGGLDANATNS
jgi:hypothetical protein